MNDKKKDDIVNKAVKFTRPFRPLAFDPKTGKPVIGARMLELSELVDLIDLCVSIENFVYGDKDESKKS